MDLAVLRTFVTVHRAGLAVLPRYLCEGALRERTVVALLEPPMPPLRTYFMAVRTGTLAVPHIARRTSACCALRPVGAESVSRGVTGATFPP